MERRLAGADARHEGRALDQGAHARCVAHRLRDGVAQDVRPLVGRMRPSSIRMVVICRTRWAPRSRRRRRSGCPGPAGPRRRGHRSAGQARGGDDGLWHGAGLLSIGCGTRPARFGPASDECVSRAMVRQGVSSVKPMQHRRSKRRGSRGRPGRSNAGRVLEAARHLVDLGGPAAVSDLLSLGRAVRVGRATLYRHWPTLEDLWHEMGKEMALQFGSSLSGDMEADCAAPWRRW